MSKQKRVILIGLIIGLLASGFLHRSTILAHAGARGPVIFYEPHPDDGMAWLKSVVKYVEEQRVVKIVFLTKGEKSNSIQELQGDPNADIDRDGDVDSDDRIQEMKNVYKACGLNDNDFYVRNYGDGNLSVGEVKEAIESMETIYPGAIHITLANEGVHSDHNAAGDGLASVYGLGIVSNARFHQIYPFMQGTTNLPRNCKIVRLSQAQRVTAQEALTNLYISWREAADTQALITGAGNTTSEFIQKPDLINDVVGIRTAILTRNGFTFDYDAASGLSTLLDAPRFQTNSNNLSADLSGYKKTIIVGGTIAINEDIEDQIRSRYPGMIIDRLGGDTEEETEQLLKDYIAQTLESLRQLRSVPLALHELSLRNL